MNNTIKEILKELVKLEGYMGIEEFAETRTFLLSSIKKVVEECPEGIEVRLKPTSTNKQIQAMSDSWKQDLIKEIDEYEK